MSKAKKIAVPERVQTFSDELDERGWLRTDLNANVMELLTVAERVFPPDKQGTHRPNLMLNEQGVLGLWVYWEKNWWRLV